MLGKRKMRDSVGYVSLGLFASALLEELLEAASDPSVAPKKTEMIKLGIDSLEAFEKPKPIERSRFGFLVFQNYQQASTLRKTVSLHGSGSGDIGELCGVLRKIIGNEVSASERSKSIKNAMGFFCELARASIMNAERQEERIPQGVIKLVSASA